MADIVSLPGRDEGTGYALSQNDVSGPWTAARLGAFSKYRNHSWSGSCVLKSSSCICVKTFHCISVNPVFPLT